MYRIIGVDGREYGPINADQLRQWITQGRANATTHVFVEGATEWKPLGSLPEFAMLFAVPTPQPGQPAVFPSATVIVQRTSGYAIAGLVLGILSITFGLCCCYGIPFSVPGLVFSILALGQIRAHPDQYHGRGMAIAGIVLCCLSFLLMAGLLVMFIITAGLDGATRHAYRL